MQALRVVNETGEELRLDDVGALAGRFRAPARIDAHSSCRLDLPDETPVDDGLTYLVAGDADRPVYLYADHAGEVAVWAAPTCTVEIRHADCAGPWQVRLRPAHRYPAT